MASMLAHANCAAGARAASWLSFFVVVGFACSAKADPASKVSRNEPQEVEPNYLRPALEIGLGLTAASLWYFVDDRNVLDWDYPSIEQRFSGEAWRFDNNTFSLNYVWHPLAGAGMYMLARGNRVGVWPSFAYSLAGSTLWEYAIEFNEKVSINDVIVTPLAGLAIGEFFHKLALDVSAAPSPSPGLAWTFGLSVYGHERLDHLPPQRRPELWRRLGASYGFGFTHSKGNERGTHLMGFSGRYVSLAGYRQPRTFARWFADAEFAAFDLELDFGEHGLGADAFAETLLAGYHYQRLEGSRLQPSGEFFTVGGGVAYTYRDTSAFGFDDRQGLLHFPGVAFELARPGRRWLRPFVALRGYPSFGSMSAPAYSRWREDHAGVRTKTVLQREGYFYGWGWKGMAEARLGAGSFELRGEVVYDRLWSLEGLDRAQERVRDDVAVAETAIRYGVSAWVSAAPYPLEFGVGFENSGRKSNVGGRHASLSGDRVLLKSVLAY